MRAVLGSTNQFTVNWQPKSGGAEKAAGLANVTEAIAVDVGDGVVQTQAVFDYQILRGSLGELLVEVPASASACWTCTRPACAIGKRRRPAAGSE